MSQDDLSQETRIRRLEERFKRFNILAGPDIDVSGSFGQGFAVNLTRRAGAGVSGTGPTGPPPVGACCVGSFCEILSASDCAGAGGIYQGDGVPCDPNPCGICPDLTLLCDSISASKSKCGFIDFIHLVDSSDPRPTAYYLSQSDFYENTCCTCGGDDDSCQLASGTSTWTYDPVPCTYSGGGSAVCPFPGVTLNIPVASNGCSVNPCLAGLLDGGTLDSLTASSFSKHFALGPACSVGTETITTSGSLSDEYTTSVLISDTEAALPAYPGTFDGSCAALRNLSDDERTYSIQRFRYKFTFAAATVPFTITWNEHTEFDAGGSSDNPMSASVGIGDTETSVFEVLEPATNGTTTITDVVCTVD